jgi:parallel beta-helix repeat protein
MACSGEEIQFSSPGGEPGYQGYLIDKTVFLVSPTPKHNLTFTSSDPENHAKLQATEDLLGFVVRLYARSLISSPGEIDRITLSHLDLDGGQNVRTCQGWDDIGDGNGDHWGSWLPECSQPGDPWCSPGGLAMDGGLDSHDPDTNHLKDLSRWSTDLVVDDLRISNVECGTALAFAGAAGQIVNTTIDLAGDHVHEPSCAMIDPDEGEAGWADGITLTGPAHLVSGNTIINATDVGIVHFGGINTEISNNTILVTEGNHGMFAGILIGPDGYGNISGGKVIGNTVISEGDSNCGGMHTGINLGLQMWNRGCIQQATGTAIGTPNQCVSDPDPPQGQLCSEGEPCQMWAFVAEDETFSLQDNCVRGAQINYLIAGLDLMGDLIESGNISEEPRRADWPSSWKGCVSNGWVDYWGPLDFAAHDPEIDGWTDQRVHCTR